MQIAFDQLFPRTPFFSERFQATVLAFAVHGLVFALGGLGLMRSVEFGMDASNAMEEVELIAAPSAAATPADSIAARDSVRQAPAIDEDEVAEPVKAKALPASPIAVPAANPLLTTRDSAGPLGDGSSPVAGTDAATMHRAGSSGSYFKPGYYRNPPPVYPEEARKLKQQGRVLLEVRVTAEGKVGSARLKQSSGYPLLDEAALKGIQNWKFRPAAIGGLRVEILADIPIRFELK